MDGVPIPFRQDVIMEIIGESELTACKSGPGALLYVADLVSDSQLVLDFTCELAERRGAQLELLHVIDPEKSSSRPDAQMSIQYSLEALARSLKSLKGNTRALLLFGHPEDVISKRAAETGATMIAFTVSGSSNKRIQKMLVRHLTQTCKCPVLLISPYSVVEMRNSLRSGAALD